MTDSQPSTRLIFALHFHQPFGNLPEVFRDATERCYLPTVAHLAAHPRIKATIHVSGPLLEWAERDAPELISELRSLVERGQVEVLGGGDQEPMLAILPDEDATGQLTSMADRCERLFGERPEGMWLAERVWEPDLARVIAQAGYAFTLLDDTHLRAAGATSNAEEPLDGHYVTDKAGASCTVLPIDRGLRSRIPFADVPDLMNYLQAHRGKTLTYGDDVEKFGLWPTTELRVWEQGWLESMLCAFEEASDWLQTIHGRDLIATEPPRGRVYIPTISYAEMGAWTLPPQLAHAHHTVSEHLQQQGMHEQAEHFLRGGIWQGFLAKYPESNLIYRKMLRASRAVQEARQAHDPSIEAMTAALYRGQCNCAYWHGLFGGLYMQHLRAALMTSLIEAHAMAAPRDRVTLAIEDHDGDLQNEVLLEGPSMDAYIAPATGGRVFEFDLKKPAFHVTSVMGRRRETYHDLVHRAQVISDEELVNVSAHDLVRATEHGLVDKLVVDHHPRGMFIDHLLDPEMNADDFDRAYRSVVDFANMGYGIETQAIEPSGATVRMATERDGHRLSKSIALEAEGALVAQYRLERPDGAGAARFASELDFTLLTPETDGGRRIFLPGSPEPTDPRPGARVCHENVDALVIDGGDMGFALHVHIEPAATVWRIPIETVSQSERGFESAYQGTAIVLSWALDANASLHEARIRIEQR